MSHEQYMQRCLELAQKGKGYTAPNPMVGAVLVHNGRTIGEGWHHAYGQVHAEVDCLNSVADTDKPLIQESTMYVSLEPCAHYGLTPPCADRLVKEQVKEVIIANKDPFEKVSGRGLEILKACGIATQTGILEQQAWWVNRRFFCYHLLKRPYIILKWAQTTDRFIAPADRSKLQITGPESQKLLHKWRTEEAAIMVGTTTALNDNPYLTARLHQGPQPLRVVLDRNITLPDSMHLHNNDAPTWTVNELKELPNSGRSFVRIAFDEQLLPNLLHKLHDAKKLSIIIEGGAALLNSFIAAGLWDEARIFTGNKESGNGITAPALTNGQHVFSTMEGNDKLNLFVNKDSRFPYAPGMEL